MRIWNHKLLITPVLSRCLPPAGVWLSGPAVRLPPASLTASPRAAGPRPPCQGFVGWMEAKSKSLPVWMPSPRAGAAWRPHPGMLLAPLRTGSRPLGWVAAAGLRFEDWRVPAGCCWDGLHRPAASALALVSAAEVAPRRGSCGAAWWHPRRLSVCPAAGPTAGGGCAAPAAARRGVPGSTRGVGAGEGVHAGVRARA